LREFPNESAPVAGSADLLEETLLL